ncbi:antiterminator Q family protein [Oxalobacter formigenes]|uniref:antiterminator Q family protein n=1 Tax=Oxalobacter formigenes TaxID=847 RepID=UPI00241C8CE2|nr:antiterminator Q family protein [Oxalobacter formigenes]
MTDWADEKLKKWGLFLALKEKGVCGFPAQSPTFRVELSGGSSGTVALVDADVMMIDGIMSRVKAEKPSLFWMGWDWYVKGLPVSSIAFHHRCANKTVYNRMSALKKHVLIGSRDFILKI